MSSEITMSNLSKNPLFSCIITFYTLILLYFPQFFKIFLSPVFILTSLLLLFLLRLGSVQRTQLSDHPYQETIENNQTSENQEKSFDLFEEKESKWVEMGFNPNKKSDYEEIFVEWNVRAPLEVIYEAYEEGEGQEEEEDDFNMTRLEKFPSLSMYYPDTDSDSDSEGDFSVTGEWDSPESVCFRCEEEDRDGLLIEIALDHDNNNNIKKKNYSGLDSGLGLDLGFNCEEDNLIEIDLSPPTNY